MKKLIMINGDYFKGSIENCVTNYESLLKFMSTDVYRIVDYKLIVKIHDEFFVYENSYKPKFFCKKKKEFISKVESWIAVEIYGHIDDDGIWEETVLNKLKELEIEVSVEVLVR